MNEQPSEAGNQISRLVRYTSRSRCKNVRVATIGKEENNEICFRNRQVLRSVQIRFGGTAFPAWIEAKWGASPKANVCLNSYK